MATTKKEDLKKEGIKIRDRSLLIAFSFLILSVLIGIQPVITGAAATEEGVKLNVLEYFTQFVFPRFSEIVLALLNYSVLGAVAPLLITLLFLDVYFGRWKNEKLGWNTAFGNSIVLLFVSVNLFSSLWGRYSENIFLRATVLPKFILVMLIMTQAVLLMTVVYLHAIPKNFSFFLASPLTINLLAFITIILVYAEIPLDIHTFTAALILYILMYLIFLYIKHLIPPSKTAKKYLKKQEEKRILEKTVKEYEKSQRKNIFQRIFKSRSQ